MRIERIAACHPAGIILREKDLSPEEYKLLAQQVAAICQKYAVPCILHSFAETAMELQAAAIHLPLPVLRAVSREEKCRFRAIGASCHSTEEALEAQSLGCTYITAGHVFETDCKRGLPGRGLSFLREVCSAVQIPVYGIGGIDRSNIKQVRAAGASGACLMSSLMGSSSIPELLRAMEERT